MDKKFKIAITVLLLMNAIFLGIVMYRQSPDVPGPDLTPLENEITQLYNKVDSMNTSVRNNNALISKIGTVVGQVDVYLEEVQSEKKKRKQQFTSDIEGLQGLSTDSLKAIALQD